MLTLKTEGDAYHRHPESMAKFGARVANHLTAAVTPRSGERKPNRIWFSQLGSQCMRKEWYALHYPGLAESLDPATKYKFYYGNAIEEATLQLAKIAGHKVEREQEQIEYPIPGRDPWILSGRIDAIIDGHTVDVKSMSTYSYNDMPPRIDEWDNDKFGYRAQLNGYNAILTPENEPFLLCVDKQLGHVKLSIDRAPWDIASVRVRAIGIIDAAGEPTKPPSRRALVPHGTTGNMKLDTICSYCSYKRECFKGLRTFLYSGKPVHLAVITKVPAVPELHYASKDEEERGVPF